MQLTSIDIEALELASRDCCGDYNSDHVAAWRRLRQVNLVAHVVGPGGAWYELTTDGRKALADSKAMTIERAVEIMNKNNHRGYNRWSSDFSPYVCVAGSPPPGGNYPELTWFEAKAVAEKYLREGASQ